MYVKELKNIINSMALEIGCNGGTQIGSHNIPSHVSFYCNGKEFEIVTIDLDYLSCGCSDGITFELKEID